MKANRKQERATPRYYRATDLMMAAVEYTRKGQPVRAAKALAMAAQDRYVVRAMEQLDDQQQDMKDAAFQQKGENQNMQEQQEQSPQDQQQQTARTLSRLIRASQERMQEQDQEQDEQDEDEQDQDENQGQDDLDLGLEQDEEPDQDEGEGSVQASVRDRLARARRNKAKRG